MGEQGLKQNQIITCTCMGHASPWHRPETTSTRSHTLVTKCFHRVPPRNNWESAAYRDILDPKRFVVPEPSGPSTNVKGEGKRKRASHSPNATGLTTPSTNMSANASVRSIVSTPQAESDRRSRLQREHEIYENKCPNPAAGFRSAAL
jgi:hypothetical protein